jgi:hypothetical protein
MGKLCSTHGDDEMRSKLLSGNFKEIVYFPKWAELPQDGVQMRAVVKNVIAVRGSWKSENL